MTDLEAQLKSLTPREREVLDHIAGDLSMKDIAAKLGVGVRTVETHKERLYRKLDIHSMVRLTHFAIAAGAVPNFFTPSQSQPAIPM